MTSPKKITIHNIGIGIYTLNTEDRVGIHTEHIIYTSSGSGGGGLGGLNPPFRGWFFFLLHVSI